MTEQIETTKPESAIEAASRVDVFVMRLRDHYNQMAPHVQERETAKLLKEAMEQIKRLTLDMGLLQIAFDDKKRLLESCEKALAERQDHVDGADMSASLAIEKACEREAAAVMGFVNNAIGAFESGFVDTHEVTLSQLYRAAQHYVKDSNNVDIPMIDEVWGKETAEACRTGDA